MAEVVIYFSRTGENYFSGAVRSISKGNTEIIAEIIAEETGAELFKVESMIKYSNDYSECIEQAKNDQKRDARPELENYPDNLEQYDTYYIGYPNYWGSMPMPLFTLLEKYDFSGKMIKPFCTHEGSGLGNSERDLRKLCPDADIRKGLAIHGGKVNTAKDAVEKWLQQ